MSYSDMLEKYHAMRKNLYPFQAVAVFDVKKKKTVDKRYLFETVIKLKMISDVLSLPDKAKHSRYETIIHDASRTNSCSYRTFTTNTSAVEMGRMIDEMELPSEYTIKEYDALLVLLPFLSIFGIVMAVLTLSYFYAFVGISLGIWSAYANMDKFYEKDVKRICSEIDSEVERMRIDLKEEIAYERKTSPDQVDDGIDSMSYLELIQYREA